jgi:hypothetical protein
MSQQAAMDLRQLMSCALFCPDFVSRAGDFGALSFAPISPGQDATAVASIFRASWLHR